MQRCRNVQMSSPSPDHVVDGDGQIGSEQIESLTAILPNGRSAAEYQRTPHARSIALARRIMREASPLVLGGFTGPQFT